MRAFARPVIVASRCLGFAACRYDGQILPQELIERLRSVADFIAPCPEMEAGLGVPRDPVRVAGLGDGRRLIQIPTGLDVTGRVRAAVEGIIKSLPEADGFILKSRSPSCGLTDTKIYAGPTPESRILGRGAGFFGAAVQAAFPDRPLEDESRLQDAARRDHFLKRVFTLAEFRRVARSGSPAELVRFQARNKLLLLAFHRTEARRLARIAVNPKKLPWAEVAAAYGAGLRRALGARPRRAANIEVLLHALGCFSKVLPAGEKAFFLGSLEQYRTGRLPLTSPVGLIREFSLRFDQTCLAEQTYLTPYPEILLGLPASGREVLDRKGRS